MVDNKQNLTTEQLALLEFCIEPQSFEMIKSFLNLEEKIAKHSVKLLKQNKLLEEVKGPTYSFWQLSRKGKDLLQL